MTIHKIEKGDTLSSIAKKYNTTVDAIARENGIADKNLIYAGDSLNIPRASSAEVTVKNELPVWGYKTDGQVGAAISSLSNSLYKEGENRRSERPSLPEESNNDEIRELVSKLTGMDFSYDPENDTAYKLIRDENRKNARLAMEDALGRATALSGGYSNSYAQGAAQQAYAGELSKTTKLIPELWEAAYDRFDSDRDALMESIDLLSELDNDEFDRYNTLMKLYLSEGEQLFDNYKWASEEEFDRFLDYTELMHKLTK